MAEKLVLILLFIYYCPWTKTVVQMDIPGRAGMAERHHAYGRALQAADQPTMYGPYTDRHFTEFKEIHGI